MPNFPPEQIADAHKLTADGEINLFEIVPATGSGTFRLKDGSDATWRSNLYTGIPLSFTGEDRSVEGSSPQPRLVIGQPNLDLSLFKPLLNDGSLDGGTLTRILILRDDMINNRLIRTVFTYRIRQVADYTRTRITLQLGTSSGGLGFTIPNRQFLPPDFPSVLL